MRHLLFGLAKSLRPWWRRPRLAGWILATLALGVGANALLFSLVKGRLLDPLPHVDGDRVVVLSERRDDGVSSPAVRLANLADVAARAASLEEVAVFLPGAASLATRDGAVSVRAARVSSGFFRVLGVEALHGRAFADGEDRPGEAAVAVLSHHAWVERFGGDAALVGRDVVLDGVAHQVVGILPPGFRFDLGGPQELWVPHGLGTEEWADRTYFAWRAVGRLAPGATVAGAATEVDHLARRLAEEHPGNAGWSFAAAPLRDELTRDARPLLALLQATAGFVLALACVHLATLLLGHYADRQGEAALRSALGARPGRIAGEVLAQTLALGATGGLAGIGLAALAAGPLARLLPADLTGGGDLALDPPVVLASLAVALAAGALVGGLPALRAGRAGDAAGLRGASARATGTLGMSRLHGVLVALEVALVLALSVQATLLLESLRQIDRVDPRFALAPRTFVALDASRESHPDAASLAAYYRRLEAAIAAVPGVTAVGAATNAPLSGDWWRSSLFVPGRDEGGEGRERYVDFEAVSPGFFAALDLPPLAGRVFGPSDDAAAPDVVVINRSLAEELFGGAPALGQRIGLDGAEGPWRTVVGVVDDVRHRGLRLPERAQVYVPIEQLLEQFPFHTVQLVVTSAGAQATLGPAIERAVLGVDPAQAVQRLLPYPELAAGGSRAERSLSSLLAAFGAVGMALAALGVYAVASYGVDRSRTELGIRMALGADRRQTIRLVLARALRPLAVGIPLGWALSALLGRLTGALLYGVSPADLPTHLAAATLLVAAVAVAALGPALRAARLSPIGALRS